MTPVIRGLRLGLVMTRLRLRARVSRRAGGAVLVDLVCKNFYMGCKSIRARLIGGGNWNNSGYTGPSSRNGNNSATNANTNVSARGWIRNRVAP